MAKIREGRRSVLLVVDVQKGVVAQAWDAARIVGNVARAVTRARDAGVPVLWVQHDDEQLVAGSDDWQWAEGLQPAPGEPCIGKHHNSAFEDTPLESQLAALGATRLVLAGCSTNWCIRATAYAALDRGYDLTLVGDAHSTGSMTLEDGRTIDAADVVAELNVAMTWVSYPGRHNDVQSSEAVAF